MLQFDPASTIFFQKFITINIIKKSVRQTPALGEENKVPLFNRSKGHGSGCTTALIAECQALFTVHFSNNTQNLCRSTVLWSFTANEHNFSKKSLFTPKIHHHRLV